MRPRRFSHTRHGHFYRATRTLHFLHRGAERASGCVPTCRPHADDRLADLFDPMGPIVLVWLGWGWGPDLENPRQCVRLLVHRAARPR